HDRILRMLQVVNDQLVVEEKGLHSIEKFLVARRIMYWQVYLHKTVLSAELMAKHIVTLLRREKASKRSGFLAPELEYFFSHTVGLEYFKNNFEDVLPHFEKLDDVSIDYSIKQLQLYPSGPLQFLTFNLMNRILHKLQWSDSPIEAKVMEETVNKCAAQYGWTPDEARKVIWEGSESNAIYNRDTDEIQILTKDQVIKPFSSFLETPISIALNRKFFICYPRKNRARNHSAEA
ncbi:MAG: hypothetical protein ABIQ02_14315, partial [Saprospiraceae bacterium]